MEKRWKQDKGALILKLGIEAPSELYYLGFRRFQADPVCFFSDKNRVAIKSSLDLHIFALIIGFF